MQGVAQSETALRGLADLKRKQAAEAAMFEQIKNDPEVAQQLFGAGPVLGSLQQPQPPPGAGPMTQQTVQPGQPPGAPQTVPGGQDLSQFATQGGPPQGTIASLGPAGQPQAHAPQNPLLELARTDPRAAMMLQQQMQGQQDRQWKLQEQQLSNGVKVAEYVSRMLQGVTDQNSLDQAREQIRLVHPQAASQVPQMYSKEGVAALQQRGATITEMALNRFNEAKARNLDMETQLFPELAKRLGMGDEAQAPSGDGATTSTATPATRTQRIAPPEYESAITEAARLYPQVKAERIKAIIAAESNFDAKAVSPAGAKGPMQLMDGTAKDMGVDNPFDIQQNVRGGTRYYAQMLTRYGGDERKALAAYNWGPGNLDKVNGDVSKAPAETQAYVARVLGGGGGGTTGTAQAPAADPRIAQLETKIAQRIRDAQIASLMKNENLSTRLNDDANRLTAEKNRLEAPQQEYLKKKAVHALELQQQQQQGAAAAQLKADTDPATKEEIDAINRSLPPDKRVPYGTTRKHLREQKLVGAEPLATKVTDDLTNITTSIQNFEELSNAVTALPTGPLTQYVEGFKERWGIDISDEKVAQRAILQGATNQLLQARSGAAISEGEYQRLLRELPNEGLDPKVFKARLANTVRQFKNLYKTKVQILRQTGHAIPDSLMEPLAAPEGAPAPKPTASNVDKFKAIKP